MSIDLLFEAKTIASTFNERQINWAFVGDIAVAIYGFVRATEDIDILIEEKSLKDIDKILEKLGFVINDTPLEFSDGFKCCRRLKFFEDGELFMLDLLMHKDLSKIMLTNKNTGKLGNILSYVINKNDLIEMKKAANRPKDKIDIEKLNNEE